MRLRQEHPGVMAYRFGRGRHLITSRSCCPGAEKRAEEALPLACEAAPLLRAVYREDVLDAVHRRAASYAYWTLCTLELDRKDHRAAAMAVILSVDRRHRFEAPHESAGFLCRCIVLCRDDHACPRPKRRNWRDRMPIERSVRFRRPFGTGFAI